MGRGKSAGPGIAIAIIMILTFSAVIGYVYVTAVNPCPSINYSFPNDYSVSMSVCSTTSTSTSSTSAGVSTTVTCYVVTTVYSLVQPCSNYGATGSNPGSCGANCQLVTSTSTTTFTTSGCTGSVQCAQNPYWSANSQKVADLVVNQGYDPNVQMLHDMNEPGCNDYVGGFPCDNTFWTTSDNIPTCFTLADFGYPQVQQACVGKNTQLGAFQNPRDGQRYEAYTGSPIIRGNACCTHTIMQPSGNDVQCPQTGCSVPAWGNLPSVGPGERGTAYAIQSDAWNGNHANSPTPSAGVDIAGPQAVDEWLRCDGASGQLGYQIATNLVNRWDGVGVGQSGGGYSTWQLGQVMFVMRVYGFDQSSQQFSTTAGTLTGKQVFTAMTNELWNLQNSQGYLPNTYNSSGGLGGHDPENMDAGLLPFSYNLVHQVQQDQCETTLTAAPN